MIRADAGILYLVGEFSHDNQTVIDAKADFTNCMASITVEQLTEGALFAWGTGVVLEELGGMLQEALQGARVGAELEGAGAVGRGLSFTTTDAVPATNWQSYESGIQGMYGGDQALEQRVYSTVVNGQQATGVADAVTSIDGAQTAVDAKYVGNWETSIRNPSSPIGQAPFALAEQQAMVDQAAKYANAYEGGVIYHTNSPELAAYYTQAFQQAGITNFQFVITPASAF
jgi:filamentous hemagglutinin